MSTITDFLTAHHRECDALYASAEKAVAAGDWDAAETKVERFNTALLGHFRMEEEILFPAFEEATGMSGGPPEIMRMEHQQVRELLERMEAARRARDTKAWLSAGETLVVLVQQHDMKEESILYPMTDQALADEAGDIVARLAEVRDGE